MCMTCYWIIQKQFNMDRPIFSQNCRSRRSRWWCTKWHWSSICRSKIRIINIPKVRIGLSRKRCHNYTIAIIFFGAHATLEHLQNTYLRLYVRVDSIAPSVVVRDLGVFLDSEQTMRQHGGEVASLCYNHIRRLKKIPRVLGPTTTIRLVFAVVTTASITAMRYSRPSSVNHRTSATSPERCCSPS